MSHLLDLQRVFWENVRSSGELHTEGFDGTSAFPASARLSIYRTAYWVRQVRVLEELFGGVRRCVDEATFQRLAVRFLRDCPSTHGAIELIGGDFVAWLATGEPALGTVAAVDFASWEVMVAPDVRAVPIHAARRLDVERCRLTVGPHVRTVARERSWLALWRDGQDVRRGALDGVERDALEDARAGISFVDLCERLAVRGDARGVFEILARWFGRGWVAALEGAAS